MTDKSPSKTEKLKDGWVRRDETSGRFLDVRTEKGVRKESAGSAAIVKEASSKRHSALKRLADR